MQNKDGDYVTILSIETVPHYEKVYNFDVQDNENYYVTEEGLLVHNGYPPKRARNHAEKTIKEASNGIRKLANNYHGRLGSKKELEILSNPDAVYLSQGKEKNMIFRKNGDIVITKSGSERGKIITSYGESGPRGESGAIIFGGKSTDPGLPINHEDIINGTISTPKGGAKAPADQIYP